MLVYEWSSTSSDQGWRNENHKDYCRCCSPCCCCCDECLFFIYRRLSRDHILFVWTLHMCKHLCIHVYLQLQQIIACFWTQIRIVVNKDASGKFHVSQQIITRYNKRSRLGLFVHTFSLSGNTHYTINVFPLLCKYCSNHESCRNYFEIFSM